MHINVKNDYIIKLDTIKKLCETGLPVEKYFDLCANYILEYELIRQGGVIPEILSEENNKNDSNSSLKENNNRKIEINKNLSIEDKLKLNLEAKNESLKNQY